MNYLTKFTHFRDELGIVVITFSQDDLVSLALLGLPKRWNSYQGYVNGRDKLPKWERLWFDLVQGEFLRNTREGRYSKGVEKDFALANKENKSKGNKTQGKESDKKKDLSNINCFHCHEYENYAMDFPQKKARKKEHVVAVAGEALASKFKLYFTLIA